MYEKPQVMVLLSSYNGEKYLREQLESLLAQKNVVCKILVRDDGSTDGTQSILHEYSEQGLLEWYAGENLGSGSSFWDLLCHSSDAQFYAFADQDDIWLPNKLNRACSMLEDTEAPTLYYSNLQIINDKREIIGFLDVAPQLSLASSLVTNRVYGCTMIFNHMLREIAVAPAQTYINAHDVKLYQIAVAVSANIIFDTDTHILYRQHENNEVGAHEKLSHVWRKRIILTIIKRKHVRSNQARALIVDYRRWISEANAEIINGFLRICKHPMLCISNRQYRTGVKKIDIFFGIAVFLGVV